MQNLTMDEIRVLLSALREKYGPGYSDDPIVGKLQAKLSILLELEHRKEDIKNGIFNFSRK